MTPSILLGKQFNAILMYGHFPKGIFVVHCCHPPEESKCADPITADPRN